MPRVRQIAFFAALGAFLFASAATAEVGGTVIDSAGGRGVAYIDRGTAYLSISLDNSKGGQVPVRLQWCNASTGTTETLLVVPGRTEGRATAQGFGFCPGITIQGGVFWSCDLSSRPLPCRFEWKLEHYCATCAGNPFPASLFQPPNQ